MATFSLPSAFCDHYKDILGDESELFFEACLKPLRKCIRVNTLKIQPGDWEREMKEKGWEYEAIPWCQNGFFIDRPEGERIPLGKTIEHFLGLIYAQEASSMLPAEILCAHFKNEEYAGKKICDLTAAPGSKSTQIAAEMDGNGLLLVNELSASRIKGLFSNLERCGVQNSILTHSDGRNLCEHFPETFDGILLDAPCTGEGTVRKDFSALKNWRKENALQMSALQKQLILKAFDALRPGGVLVYSTCTLAKEENEDVLDFLFQERENAFSGPLCSAFTGAEKACTSEGFLRLWPHTFDTEGFFVAKIVKKESSSVPPRKEKKKGRSSFPFAPLRKREEEELKKYFQETWGCDISEVQKKGTFWKREKDIWLFPEGAEDIFASLRCDRIGIPLCTLHEKEIRLRHEAGIAFGSHFTCGIFSISEEEGKRIMQGGDLFKELSEKREYLAQWRGFPVALGKYDGERWKNGIPRENVLR